MKTLSEEVRIILVVLGHLTAMLNEEIQSIEILKGADDCFPTSLALVVKAKHRLI